ncbi:unnamed protein product [Heligmosomoides polygyrus]|uniref:Glutaminase n=1 Tax=Heligmosomoides polygyrus TaxID=6339 RepID=A0A183GUI1_HELPZ|nr:unnamed protein product [Heligmosomoides polygyrus]
MARDGKITDAFSANVAVNSNYGSIIQGDPTQDAYDRYTETVAELLEGQPTDAVLDVKGSCRNAIRHRTRIRRQREVWRSSALAAQSGLPKLLQTANDRTAP